MNRPRLAPAVLAPLIAVSLAACGSGGDEGSGAATTTSPPGATESASPTDTSTATPRTQKDLEESVSAAEASVRASASAELSTVEGRGNATGDVSLQGVATTRSDGLRTGLVRVNNSTDKTAFYSVQVDFVTGDGTVVDSVVAGFPDVGPGKRAERYVSSRKAGESDTPTTPRITKAERS
ncbi:hypothetical protein GLX30_03005 [Streptomyces sp. Tu 2975]|uniref:hypothetical protein n=1 Tax=Streptomyces sp. Tu 2975 TaxID=2676871 RepID=UPI00135A0F8F|nr:hypothetical protein [Streptomyces sp. Tu 2975]QIP83215.1 hypothetical protein GLX30_03005 [Streptomyces sp. Tu 2975]